MCGDSLGSMFKFFVDLSSFFLVIFRVKGVYYSLFYFLGDCFWGEEKFRRKYGFERGSL